MHRRVRFLTDMKSLLLSLIIVNLKQLVPDVNM